MIAWEKEADNEGLETSPILVEITMGLRLAYVVIVPMLHGAVMDRKNKEENHSITFKKYKSMSIYSIMNHKQLQSTSTF